MRHRILFLPPARFHVREAAQWWRENRASPELLERELDTALRLLARHPDIGPPVLQRPGVRRLLLRKTQYHLYYRVDRAAGVVRIVALWHTARGSEPEL